MNSSEEKLPSQLPKPESHTPQPSLRIPTRRPHFRSADISRIDRAKILRVKLWRLHSCNFTNDYQKRLRKMKGGSSSLRFRRLLVEFQHTIKHPTLRKCLKHVRRITFPSNLLSRHRCFLRICRTMRLYSLSTLITPITKPKTLVKAFMNSKLRYCFLYDSSKASNKDFILKLIPIFRRLNKCKLIVEREENDIKMLLNTDKLRLSSKPFTEPKSTPESLYISDQATISPLNSFERMSFKCYNPKPRGREFIPNLPPLPNLKTLDFVWQGLVGPGNDQKKPLDLSFVQQYPKLESFKIQIMNGEIETLDFLASLPDLKEFYFSMSNSELRSGLPNLTKLEKFGFTKSDEQTPDNIDDLRNFIQKNINLKALDLSLPMQNVATIFKDVQDSTLHHLEKLQLNFLQSLQPPEIQSANQIAQMLKTQSSLCELCLEFQKNTSDWSSILLKEGLAEMKSLKSLALKFHHSSVEGTIPQTVHFAQFPDIFQNLENLTAIDLYLGARPLDSAEVCFILDGLGKLKNLKKFKLTAVLAKLKPVAFDRLLSFFISIRHDVKSFNLYLRGVHQQEINVFKKNLLPRFTLSQNQFTFI